MPGPAAVILIVDDEPQNCRLLERFLQPEGYRTLIAAGGEEALAAIAQEPPDLILLDIMMPGADGYKVASKLKADPATSDIPIIIVTQRTDQKALLAGLSAGAEEFLMKPVNRVELLLRVRNLLHLKRLGDSSKEHNTVLEQLVQARTADLQRFRAAMQISADGIVLVDRTSMRLIDVNQTLCDMVGRTRKELLGMTPMDLSDVDRMDLERAYDALIADNNGNASAFEGTFRHKDGSRIPVETRRRALHTDDGWIIVGSARDTTERLRADELQRESNQLLDNIVDNIPTAVQLKSVRDDFRIVLWNKAAEAMYGLSRSAAIGHNVHDLWPEADADQMHASDLDLVASGIGQNHPDRAAQTKDRGTIRVHMRKAALFDAGGNATHLLVIADDITAQLADQARLRESERRFSDMLGNVELISVMLDRNARITYCNDYLLRLTGWRREEVQGHSWAEIFFAPGDGKIKDRLAAILAGLPGSTHGENEIITRSGERRLIRWNNSLLRSGAGDVVGTASIGEDITGQKQAAINIERLNRVYSMLSGINNAIVRNQERGELFSEVCRIAVSEGGFILARVIEVDAGGKARIAATTEPDSQLFQGIIDEYNSDPAHSGSLLAVTLRSAQPVISNSVADDPRIPNRAALTKAGNYALALLPIIVERRIVGTIILRSKEAGLFDSAEVHLLGELISNLSFALEHMENEKKVRRLTRVYAVLSGINSLIVRVRDRNELFKEACRIAIEQGSFRLAWIGVVDRPKMELRPVASAGTTEDSHALINQRFSLLEDAPTGNTLSARALRERKAIVSNDVECDPQVVFKEEHAKRGSRSMALLPLLDTDEVIGLLALYSTEVGFFDEAELKLLTELASDISFAVRQIGKQDRLDYLAYYDDLTGLANRSLFLERVAQYMRSAVRDGYKLALFFVDLERFRNINDSLGRPAGDALLQQVSEWLSHSVGDPNLLAHLGADQFAIVLPEIKQNGNVAGLLEKRVRAFLEKPFHLGDAEYRIAAKVGIALFPNDGTDADTLLRNAEAALKKAKARGDRYLFYKPKMNATAAGKLSLENQLRQALDKEEFVLHYQPKVTLESGKLTGAEALIRWNDPRTGLVPPGRFIPILEETGLIYDVGRWALRKAIENYLRWSTAGLPAVRIAVNVSPLQLRNPGFIAEIAQVIGVDARAAAGLELEITESLIMDDIAHNIASLHAIRAMGVTVAIDDFGTGFSSLSWLAKLPVDTLKIDRSFVVEMTAGPLGRALVPTIINLAHSLRLKVVAEGVETEEQSRLLRLLGCDEMQGFLLSKPVPGEIFETNFLSPVLAAA